MQRFRSKDPPLDSYFIISFTGYSMYPFLKPGDRLVVRQVFPVACKIGDILVARNGEDQLMVHRLIKLLPNGRGITKGDSLLAPDPEPVELSGIVGRVEVLLRGGRLIPISSGTRYRLKGLYALLSRMGLTSGALKLKIKHRLSPYLTSIELKDDQQEIRNIPLIIRGKWQTPIAGFNWNRMVKDMHRQGMSGIAYQYLKDKDIPASALAKLEKYYRAIAAQNLIHIHALEQLEEALVSLNLEIMALKGAALLTHAYPKLGMRPMEDLDLMVRPEDRDPLAGLLQHMGYQQDMKLNHLFKKGKITLDLHSHALDTDRIQSRVFLFPAGMGPIWEKSMPLGKDYRWIRRPHDVDNIFLLSQHLLKHYFSRLIWIEDIYRLSRNRDQNFWIELRDRADELEQRRPFSYTLFYLKEYYHFEPLRGSRLEKLPDEISSFERKMLSLKNQEQPFDLLALVMALFCIRGVKNQIQFGLENLFPAKEVMKSEFGGVVGAIRVLFYPVRLLQSLAKLIRHLFRIIRAVLL